MRASEIRVKRIRVNQGLGEVAPPSQMFSPHFALVLKEDAILVV